MQAFYAEQPEVLRNQLAHRFRHISQYTPASLSNHLEKMRHGVAFEPQRPVAYMQPGSKKPLEEVLGAIRNETVPFGCIQDMEKFPPAIRERIHTTLREKFRDTLPQ